MKKTLYIYEGFHFTSRDGVANVVSMHSGTIACEERNYIWAEEGNHWTSDGIEDAAHPMKITAETLLRDLQFRFRHSGKYAGYERIVYRESDEDE